MKVEQELAWALKGLLALIDARPKARLVLGPKVELARAALERYDLMQSKHKLEEPMARVYQITEEEMMSLIETLELVKLREFSSHAPNATVHRQDIDDLHRTFHLHVVRWAQAMGFRGIRG
jgi:hypothetical protein